MAVIHESMAGTAKAMASVSAMGDYEFVTVGYPHMPLAIWTPEEVADAARQVADAIRIRLTKDSD